jgi:hypothetical protein
MLVIAFNTILAIPVTTMCLILHVYALVTFLTQDFALQIQEAHDFLSELELKPLSAIKTAAPKAKKRAPQILCRTDNDCDQLVSSGDLKLSAPNAFDQPQGGCAASVDFSDVSLDWGLGKLVSNCPSVDAVGLG